MRLTRKRRSVRRLGVAGCALVLASAALPAGQPAFAGPVRTGSVRPAAVVADPAAAVNTIVQTGAGNNFPGAQAPFGAIQFSPNTNGRGAGGNYRHNDNQLRGYGLTALAGPGCGAMGDDPILPLVGGAPTDVNGTMTSLDHSSEIATAGYYAAKSSNGQIRTELTATQRSGLARITYPATKQAAILVKLRDSQNQKRQDQNGEPSTARIVGNNEIVATTMGGHFCGDKATYVLHFDVVFDRPFTSSQILGPGPAGPTGVFVNFDTTTNPVIQAKVGVSFVSDANARQNWQSENAGWDFNKVRTATHDAYNRYLKRIEISGGTATQQTVFYSNLYHQLNHPNVVSDVNGQYVGYDNKVHTIEAGQRAHYQNFSGWDIYHNQAALAALIAPAETGDMATSLKQAYDQAGAIPQWGFMNSFNGVMIGDSAPALVAEYHAFGARSIDDKALLADLVKQARTDNRVRRNTSTYDRLGYTPDSPSLTIEWTQQDFALSRLAYALGDKANGDFLAKRANNWKNIFDPSTKLLAPRHTDGTFEPVTPSTATSYVEGTAAQYRFQVPNNQPAFAKLLGGNAATNALLDDLFQSFNNEMPTRAFLTNEFSQGQQWFYNWTGKPSSTQSVVHRWLTKTYANDCCTYPNNDDLGTMSAQYVWATMGIYPENLGTTDVTLNAPTFTQVVIHLNSGKTLTINAPQASASNYYVQSLRFNGAASTKTWLPGTIFTNGATVDFTLGASPTSWGSGPADAPPSYDGSGTPPPGGGQITGIAGKCVAAGARGEAIAIDTCDGSDAQKWTVGADGSLRAVGGCMDVAAAGTANGTKVQSWDCNGTVAQVWRPDNGRLVNPNSGKCLDVPSGSTADGTRLDIASCTNAANQGWNLPG